MFYRLRLQLDGHPQFSQHRLDTEQRPGDINSNCKGYYELLICFALKKKKPEISIDTCAESCTNVKGSITHRWNGSMVALRLRIFYSKMNRSSK